MEAISLAILVLALVGSVALLAALIRFGQRGPTAAPLRFVVISICIWISINLAIVVITPAEPAHFALWALPVAAATAAGVTAVTGALVAPRWRMAISTWTLLAIHPTVMLLLAAVPAWHDLVFTTTAAGQVHYGPMVYVHSAAMLVQVGLTVLRVMRARRRLPAIAAMSGWLIVVGWLAPLVAGVVSAAHLVPSGVDLTSAGAAVSAMVVWVGALRPGLLELQPIARDWVFDKLHDAVFVVGVDGIIVDCNDRAGELLRRRDVKGALENVVLAEAYPEFMDVARADKGEGAEVDLTLAEDELVVWVSATTMERQSGIPLGWLIQVRDMTETALQHREAESMRLALEAEARANASLRVELSEQVMRDPATGLRNRRFVSANVPAMMLRAVSEGTPFSVLMFDVDHFKQVNDLHGHTVGDRVISAVATVLADKAPGDAEVVRFGGEEFLVVLPGVDEDEASEAAESLRLACARLDVPTRDGNVSVNLSAGVATATIDHHTSDQLIDDADRALYIAKQEGRDRTVVWRAEDFPEASHGIGALNAHGPSA